MRTSIVAIVIVALAVTACSAGRVLSSAASPVAVALAPSPGVTTRDLAPSPSLLRPTAPPSTLISPMPTASALAAAALAQRVGLADQLAQMCIADADGFIGMARLGPSIHCAGSDVSVDVTSVTLVDEEICDGTCQPDGVLWDWFIEPARIVEEEQEGSDEEESGADRCTPGQSTMGRYAVGTHFAGTLAGCRDEDWLLWTLDELGLIARAQLEAGSFGDVVQWFRGARPVGGLQGAIWELRPEVCWAEPSRCDSPLPRTSFPALWKLARPLPYQELVTAANQASRSDGDAVPYGPLVRLTGRLLDESDDVIVLGTRRQHGSWVDTVRTNGSEPLWMLVGRNATIDVVGWVRGGITCADAEDEESCPDDAPTEPWLELAAFRVRS